MVKCRHAGCGKAQQKSVESEVVIDLAAVGRALVLVEAADAATVEIAQVPGIPDRLPQRRHIAPHAHGFADIAPERAHAHDQRRDRIEERRPEQRGHGVVRHQFVERTRARVDAEQNLPIVQCGKAEDERGDAERGNEADDEPVAREGTGKGAWPDISGVGLRARHRKRLRNVDVEFMRRRELAIGVAGAAGVAEIGEIIEIAVGKRAAHFHRRKYRAQALAIAARIADRHQAVGLGEDFGAVHVVPVPVRSGLLGQALALQPILDQAGDLPVVLVHHHHV